MDANDQDVQRHALPPPTPPPSPSSSTEDSVPAAAHGDAAAPAAAADNVKNVLISEETASYVEMELKRIAHAEGIPPAAVEDSAYRRVAH